jgi:Spy/CpxP family protein refolding chaperone
MAKTGRVWAGACIVLLAAAPAALAEKGRRGDPQKHLDKLAKKLELNEAQRGQVEQIMNDYRGRMDALKDQLQALQQEKHERIKAVLTPEQQKKFQTMKHPKSRRSWFKKRES